MKVMFDTKVVLDVLLAREPHVDAATKLFTLVDTGVIKGSICATTATTVYYIAARSFGHGRPVRRCASCSRCLMWLILTAACSMERSLSISRIMRMRSCMRPPRRTAWPPS